VDVYNVSAEKPSKAEGWEYIYTAEELAAICLDDPGKKYALGADIDIPPGWVPIGRNATALPRAFKGSLDGRGHTIVGVNIYAVGEGTFGLFARLEGADISNLILAEANIYTNGDLGEHSVIAGLLAGAAVGGSISNVTIARGQISLEGHGLAGAMVGGLIGSGADLRLDDIIIDIKIDTRRDSQNVSREMPSNHGHAYAVAVGGLAGHLTNCTVAQSYVRSAVINANAEAVGGVVGLAIDTSFFGTGIDSGIISQSGNSHKKGGVAACNDRHKMSCLAYKKNATGGFAGRIEGTGTIYECHSHADVTGGIAGGFAGQISGSQLPANANHALEIAECSATGKTTSGKGGIAGGFVGKGEYVLISDSSAYGNTAGCIGAGGFVGQLSNLSRVIYAYAKGDVTLATGVAHPVGVSQPAITTTSVGPQTPSSRPSLPGFAGGFVGMLTNTACVEFSYSAGSVIAGESSEMVANSWPCNQDAGSVAVGGFVGLISSTGTPNTITHCLSFAPWVVGNGYVHRFAGRVDHDGVNGCYAHLGSMVVRGGSITHVLPSAFGADGADMSMAQVEDVIARLGWRRPAPATQSTSHPHN